MKVSKYNIVLILIWPKFMCTVCAEISAESEVGSRASEPEMAEPTGVPATVDAGWCLIVPDLVSVKAP